jgi:hypothetical protein
MAQDGTSLAEASSHNVPPATFLKHYRTIRDLKDQHAELGTAVARAKKAAKSDGVDLDALKIIEKLSSLDVDEAELQLKHVRIYAQWLESPLVTQIAMFAEPEPEQVDDTAAQEQREWVAGGRGFDAGEAGHERDTNPFEAGAAEFVAWDKSWARGHKVFLNGQKKIAGEMGPKKKAAAKEKANGHAEPARKRGRPKASEAAALL